MGLLLGVLFISVLCGLLVSRPVYLLAKWLKYPQTGKAISVAVTLVVIWSIFPSIFYSLQNRTYLDMDPQAGERRWSQYGLPSGTTSDFRYHEYYSVDGISRFSDFKMSQANFLNWMAAQGWKPEGIEKDLPAFVWPILDSEELGDLEINNGYQFEKDLESQSSWLSIVYDANEERVYISDSSY